MDELMGNLQTYEMRRNGFEKAEVPRDKGLALKTREGTRLKTMRVRDIGLALKKLVFIMLDTVEELNEKIDTLENINHELDLDLQNFKCVESKLKSKLNIITFEKESLE